MTDNPNIPDSIAVDFARYRELLGARFLQTFIAGIVNSPHIPSDRWVKLVESAYADSLKYGEAVARA